MKPGPVRRAARWLLGSLVFLLLTVSAGGAGFPRPPSAGTRPVDLMMAAPVSQRIPAPTAPPDPTLPFPPEPAATPIPTSSTPPAEGLPAGADPLYGDPVWLLTPLPIPTATPDPLAPYTIPALAARRYGEGDILVREVVGERLPFHRYVVEYPSDGLTVTALANVPFGQGPFPVVVILHGYIPPEVYERGADSLPVADFFAGRGYAAIMPDYRGYAGTAGGPNPLRIPYAIDVLNLIESLDTLDVLDESQVGIIGHSMGGGAATYVMVLSERVRAVVLYAPMSADQAVNWRYIGEVWAPYWMQTYTARHYGSPHTNPRGYAQISPINYLDRVHAPVQIHHGTADDQVPFEWSRDLAIRLSEAGADVALFAYEGAGHTFTGADWLLFLERSYAFMEEHVRGTE